VNFPTLWSQGADRARGHRHRPLGNGCPLILLGATGFGRRYWTGAVHGLTAPVAPGSGPAFSRREPGHDRLWVITTHDPFVVGRPFQ
jgi:hypothetical protein